MYSTLNKNTQTNADWAVAPLVVRRTMLFFSIMTWFGLAGCTVGAFATADGNYWFGLPAILYALLLLFFAKFEYEPGKGLVFDPEWRSHSWAGQRYSRQTKRVLIFLGISLLLVTALSLSNFSYFSMFFVLMGHTIGMLEWPWNMTMVGGEILVFLGQSLLLSNSYQFNGDTYISISISAIIGLSYATVIVSLVRSRLKSETLVRELQETKQRLEAALAKEQEVAILQERNRMAREMHDILGHALVLVAVKLEAAQRLQKIDPARGDAEIETVKQLVRQSMNELRSSLADLRSPLPAVGNKSLAENFLNWANQTAKEGCFELITNLETPTENLPLPFQETLWRVGREALLNVVKHAAASKVWLTVQYRDETVVLSIADNGAGIPHLAEGKARLEIEGHYGVRGMRERLEAIGGHFLIELNAGQGTRITATLPLPTCEALTKSEPKQGKFLSFRRG